MGRIGPSAVNARAHRPWRCRRSRSITRISTWPTPSGVQKALRSQPVGGDRLAVDDPAIGRPAATRGERQALGRRPPASAGSSTAARRAETGCAAERRARVGRQSGRTRSCRRRRAPAAGSRSDQRAAPVGGFLPRVGRIVAPGRGGGWTASIPGISARARCFAPGSDHDDPRR